MFGDEEWDITAKSGQKGLIYEAVDFLLQKALKFHASSASVEDKMIVEGSFFEVYNEQVRDLMRKDPGNLSVMNNAKTGGVTIKELKTFKIESVEDLRKILILGNSKRVKASTLKNKFSSRSHAIVQITVTTCTSLRNNKVKYNKGKLMMVDLAGSEKIDAFERHGKNKGTILLL